MDAAAILAGMDAWLPEDADGEYPACTGCIGGKRENHRPRADHSGGCAKPARSAQTRAVPIKFVTVFDRGWSQNIPFPVSGRHRDGAAIPSIAFITRVAVCAPTLDVIRQTDIAVIAACGRAQVHHFPAAVVRVRLGLVRIVAGMESPWAIEQWGGSTQCGRVGPAADRQDR